MGWLLGMGLGVMLFCFVLGIASFVFWIAMLIDCLKKKFSKDNDKIVWVLVLVFAGIIGAVIYYFVAKKK